MAASLPRALRRHARILGAELRSAAILALQYRLDFLVDGLLDVLGTATALLPLFVVFHRGTGIAGWSFGEALVVTGWFTLLQGILSGVLEPNLVAMVEHIRKGTLDFVLLKPADAQFLVSTCRFQPLRAMNMLAALVVFAEAFALMGRLPSAEGLLASLLLLGCAVTILYSLWTLTVCAAFYMGRIDNLTSLFGSIFSAARWPASVFRGAVRAFFTFVIPLATMTTFPAEALLGRLSLADLVTAPSLAIVFAWIARQAWLRSIRRYSSASS